MTSDQKKENKTSMWTSRPASSLNHKKINLSMGFMNTLSVDKDSLR